MSAPSDMTVANITGKYAMNSKGCKNTDEILKGQGIGWGKRTALSVAPVTITITQTKPADGSAEVLQVESVALKVISSSETIILDGETRKSVHPLWGNITLSAKKIKIADISAETLKEGPWLGEEVIEVIAENETDVKSAKWTAVQIWGFQTINGEHRYFRRVRLTHSGEPIDGHMLYDYSPIDA
ncbi:hypothetical protein TWF694_010809 [Orbilia ellipsospora]|uniref:LCCL domain-containing protein n=1 Tax=Orbilia ellipsospora TaxID=2528407 RepID=A0AAV9X8C4_9PEZI